MTLRNTLIGSLFIALDTFLFATADTIVKLSSLSVSQLLFGRWFIQFIIAILMKLTGKHV